MNNTAAVLGQAFYYNILCWRYSGTGHQGRDLSSLSSINFFAWFRIASGIIILCGEKYEGRCGRQNVGGIKCGILCIVDKQSQS